MIDKKNASGQLANKETNENKNLNAYLENKDTISSSKTFTVKFDGNFDISTGRSRKSTNWKNRETSWGYVLNKLSTTHRTHETLQEYLVSKKDRQDEIKDIG